MKNKRRHHVTDPDPDMFVIAIVIGVVVALALFPEILVMATILVVVFFIVALFRR